MPALTRKLYTGFSARLRIIALPSASTTPNGTLISYFFTATVMSAFCSR